MKKIHKYIAVPVACMLLASCEKEIVVDVPEYEPKLVLNSYMLTGDTVYVSVGKSVGILEYKNGKDLSIANATVILRADGQPDDVLEYDVVAGAYRSHTVAQVGKTYTLAATAPGFAQATASTTAPGVVAIERIQRIARAKVDIDGNPQDELRIVFKDPPQKGDYYILSINKPEGVDTLFYSRAADCVNTTDASIESVHDESIDVNTCLPGDAIFFRDVLFNGMEKELRLFVPSGYVGPDPVFGDSTFAEVQLYHVTEDYFRYRKSYRFAADNEGNPFAEPTNVYTNVKNGYGIFSVMSVDVMQVK